jgi:HEXXH motif-containing protein
MSPDRTGGPPLSTPDREHLVRDVGTGIGGDASIEVLRQGQLAKRLIMLKMLLSEVEANFPSDADRAGLAAAFGYLVAAQRTHPDDVDELLRYPNLGRWLAVCLRRIQSGPPGADLPPLWADLGYLGWLATSSLVSVGGAGVRTVVVRDGIVMLPRIGLARLDPVGESGLAEARWDGATLTFTSASSTLAVDPHGPEQAAWVPLRTLWADDERTVRVFLDDLDPFRDLSDQHSSALLGEAPPRLTGPQADEWQTMFRAGWLELATHHRAYLPAIRRCLAAIVPLTALPGRTSASNTSFDAFGCVNTSAPGAPHLLALTLIHEMQHAKLAALTDQVRLHNSDRTPRFYAPWRDDPRPLYGLLQGIYAHLAVTEFWRVHRRTRHSPLAEIEFARWRTQVAVAIAEVAGSGLLTDDGQIFVASVVEATRGWTDEAVSARADEIARESAHAHRVAWRVRNLRPDEGSLGKVRDAWAAGRVPPAEAQTSHRIDPAEVPSHYCSRPAASYLAVSRSASASPADVAYASGDMERAYALYVVELSVDPLHPQPWAGLSLTLPRLVPATGVAFDRPEVLAHLWPRIAPSGANLTEFIGWLAAAASSPE